MRLLHNYYTPARIHQKYLSVAETERSISVTENSITVPILRAHTQAATVLLGKNRKRAETPLIQEISVGESLQQIHEHRNFKKPI